MKHSFLLTIIALFVASTGAFAQVVTPNASTIENQTLTIPENSEESSSIDLHLDGSSTINFTITDATNEALFLGFNEYSVNIKVIGANGVEKVSKELTYGSIKIPFIGSFRGWRIDNDYNRGRSATGTLTVPNGETGDVVVLTVGGQQGWNGFTGGRPVVSCTVTGTATKRYDIYEDRLLFGATGNNIVDHRDPIDVYVHRELAGDGAWGTLCLPFSMSDAQMKSTFKNNNLVYAEFDGVDPDHNIIKFTTCDNGIEAGKPYVIRNDGPTISNFFADDVTFTESRVRAANAARKSNKEDRGYYLVGTLEPKKVNTDDYTYSQGRAVYIAKPKDGQQELKKLTEGGTIQGFRAYFVFPAEKPSSAKETLTSRMFSLDDALSGTTDVARVSVDGRLVDNRIYSLSGTYVGTDAKTLPKGVYVRGGKKFVVR